MTQDNRDQSVYIRTIEASRYEWRDLGDSKPVRVMRCSMCGIAPSNVDDCGEFGNSKCPYFGKDYLKEDEA